MNSDQYIDSVLEQRRRDLLQQLQAIQAELQTLMPIIQERQAAKQPAKQPEPAKVDKKAK